MNEAVKKIEINFDYSFLVIAKSSMLNNEYKIIKETLFSGFCKNKIMNIFTLILIKFIKAYKYLISPLLGHSCRYLPTCSEYSIDALKEYGFFKGLLISIKRILSCHPIKFLGGGEGFDPVKKEIKDNK